MIERFQGISGNAALTDALTQQKLVLGDRVLANKMAEIGILRELKIGDVLIEQDAVDNDVYFIVAGRLSMAVNAREVAQRVSGEHIGEMSAVMPSLPRAATGTATEPSLVLQVTASQFAELAEEFTNIWRYLTRVLAQRLHQRNALVQPTNTAARVFIICTVEALPIARAIETHFQHDTVFVKIWTEGVFRASTYPIESLEAQLDQSDFAIAIAQPDDKTQSRGEIVLTPRDNVMLELGMFIGRLTRKRTFLLEPMNEHVKLPTDLSGLTTIRYKTGDLRDLASLMGPACNELRNYFTELGPR